MATALPGVFIPNRLNFNKPTAADLLNGHSAKIIRFQGTVAATPWNVLEVILTDYAVNLIGTRWTFTDIVNESLNIKRATLRFDTRGFETSENPMDAVLRMAWDGDISGNALVNLSFNTLPAFFLLNLCP